MADFFSDHPGGRIETHPQRFDTLDAIALTEALLDRRMHGALWNKLIRRDAYSRFRADFSENLTFGEDMVTIMKMLSKGATVSFMHKGYYHYCYNNTNSLTSSPTRDGYDRRVRWIEACEPYAGERFRRHIDAKRFNAKFFGLIHGLVDRKEFYSYGPNSPRWLPSLVGFRKYQPAMALATLRLYPLARLWCKAIHRLSRRQ